MHNPMLHRLLASSRVDDLRRAAASPPRYRAEPPSSAPGVVSAVTLRFALPDDDLALARLAALDSAAPPSAPVLAAEVEGELRAALSLADGAVIADPFHHTHALIHLLRARAEQLSAARSARRLRLPFRLRPARLRLDG